MKTRESAVAGTFYPKTNEAVKAKLRELIQGTQAVQKSSCVVAPHAGWEYSGRVAARAFKALEESGTFVVLSPNHTGLGPAISVSDADFWETPLGKIEVDKGLREKLLAELGIEADELAHIGEHSIELQLPFIQHLFPKAMMLPITIGTQEISQLESLGKALFEASKAKSVGVVASGDFSHHIPETKAKQQDMEAIGFIEKMDFMGFHRLVTENNLSICGLAPITAAMVFCTNLGLKKGRLLEYDSSASSTGDNSSVVGYAGIAFG